MGFLPWLSSSANTTNSRAAAKIASSPCSCQNSMSNCRTNDPETHPLRVVFSIAHVARYFPLSSWMASIHSRRVRSSRSKLPAEFSLISVFQHFQIERDGARQMHHIVSITLHIAFKL